MVFSPPPQRLLLSTLLLLLLPAILHGFISPAHTTTTIQPFRPQYHRSPQAACSSHHHNPNLPAFAGITSIPTRLHAKGRFATHNGDKSTRQARVSELVRAELAKIIHNGYEIRGPRATILHSTLRHAINVLGCDVSPDLRNCRVDVSVISTKDITAANKREAFGWLTANLKAIKHALARRLSHMQRCPELVFKLTDIGKEMELMRVLDAISKGDVKRDTIVTHPMRDDGWENPDEEEEEGWENGEENGDREHSESPYNDDFDDDDDDDDNDEDELDMDEEDQKLFERLLRK
jgi:ribosome-binding factor A